MARSDQRLQALTSGHDLAVWRGARLRRAGFDGELAEALARDGHYDIHALLELVDRGCPPDLAARILAPIDERRTAC